MVTNFPTDLQKRSAPPPGSDDPNGTSRRLKFVRSQKSVGWFVDLVIEKKRQETLICLLHTQNHRLICPSGVGSVFSPQHKTSDGFIIYAVIFSSRRQSFFLFPPFFPTSFFLPHSLHSLPEFRYMKRFLQWKRNKTKKVVSGIKRSNVLLQFFFVCDWKTQEKL